MASTLLVAIGTAVLFLVSGAINSVFEIDGVWILPVAFFWLGVFDSFIQVPYYDTIMMGVLAIPVLVVVAGVGLFLLVRNESQSPDSQSDAVDMDGVSKYFQSEQETNTRGTASSGTNNTIFDNSESGESNVAESSASEISQSDNESSDTEVYESDRENSDTKIYRG